MVNVLKLVMQGSRRYNEHIQYLRLAQPNNIKISYFTAYIDLRSHWYWLGALEETFSSFSKCLRALRILIKVASEGILGSDISTMTYVLLVKPSMNAANTLLRT